MATNTRTKKKTMLSVGASLVALALASASAPVLAGPAHPYACSNEAEHTSTTLKRPERQHSAGAPTEQESKRHLHRSMHLMHRAHQKMIKPAESSFSVTVSDTVAQDRIRIVLSAQIDGATQSEVNERLTQSVQQAFESIGASSGAVVSTGGFQVNARFDTATRTSTWHGSAQIRIESENFDLASQLAAKASDQMAINDVSFYVSEARRAQTEDALIAKAGEAFQARAKSLSGSLGFERFRITATSLGNQGVMPMPRSMARFASAEGAVHVGSNVVPMGRGEERIDVTLGGTIEMHKKREQVGRTQSQ